jgi:hypothetical protein
MADVSRLTFWHKLGHWPLVELSFIGNGSYRSHGRHRSHESTGHWTWEPGHARWPGSRRSCSFAAILQSRFSYWFSTYIRFYLGLTWGQWLSIRARFLNFSL